MAEYQRLAGLVAAKINDNDTFRSELEAAVAKSDTRAAVAILEKAGLRIEPDQRVVMDSWKKLCGPAPSSGPEKMYWQCAKYRYELEPYFTWWGGFDWRVVEYCGSLRNG